MNIIVDTHIFIWLLKKPERISAEHYQQLTQPHTFFLSSISIAEMMIKASIGKLTVDYDPILMAKKSGLSLLDFSAKDAVALKELPFHHKDPFDRMLISQSMTQKIPIMTNDKQFTRYNCHLV